MVSPKVITTSVVRSVQKGESHGGIYLVDLGAKTVEQVVDWDRIDIDWAGRGLDRGLRGIAFHRGLTFIAASDEILAFDHSFRVVERYRNAYLRHCHEIDIEDGVLWATSTGFDSLLALDLRKKQFTRGYCLRHGLAGRWRRRLLRSAPPNLQPFDPETEAGPEPGDTFHLNMVKARDGILYCGGTRLKTLIRIADDRLSGHAMIPLRTHNAQPYRGGVLMNYTEENVVRHANKNGRIREEWPVVTYNRDRLLFSDLPEDYARQGFARGLCTTEEGDIIVGSSPATVSQYAHGDRNPKVSINLTMDVRNSIHGLQVYPY